MSGSPGEAAAARPGRNHEAVIAIILAASVAGIPMSLASAGSVAEATLYAAGFSVSAAWSAWALRPILAGTGG